MSVATARHPRGKVVSVHRADGLGSGRVLIVNSPEFGAVSLFPAWVCEGAFVFDAVQPSPREVFAGFLPGGAGAALFREVSWGAAVAVSLPDGVHVLDATEVHVALHASGAELEYGMSADALGDALLAGLARLGVTRVRAIAADWASVCTANARDGFSAVEWRKQVRRVWGSCRRMDRASMLKCDLLTAVMSRG